MNPIEISFRLVAPSINHLCKSVIFENTRCSQDSIEDPLNSKYYCVITQVYIFF